MSWTVSEQRVSARAGFRFITVGLVLLTIAAVVILWKSKPRDSIFQEPGFRVTLPGKWKSLPSSDPTRWVYQSSQDEQLTVSIFGLKDGLTDNERFDGFVKLVELRRNAETEMPGSETVTTTEPVYARPGRMLAARYNGIQPSKNRRFSCLALGSSSAVTFFYYEAIGVNEDQFEARAQTIMNAIIVSR